MIQSKGELVNDLASALNASFTEGRNATRGSAAFTALQSIVMSRDPTVNSNPPVTAEVSAVISSFKRLGMLDDGVLVPKTPSATPIDSLCAHLQSRMAYRSHERDYVLMLHRVTAYFPASKKTRIYKSKLSIRGTDLLRTATALTVGVPVGATAQLILDNGLAKHSGLMIPTEPDLYNPVLRILEEQGIAMHEETEEE